MENNETPITSNEQHVFVQGEKTETVKKALSMMRELTAKFEVTTDPQEREKIGLYEFPKMMEAIREVAVENLSHPETPFLIEKESEFRKMRDANLITDSHIERQYELAEQYKK